MTDAHDIVSRRWDGLRALSTASPAEWGDTLTGLAQLYGAPGRYYHNLDHIGALLTLSENDALHLRHRDVVDLAIFFHDAIYDSLRDDNELKSADLARHRLSASGVAPEIVYKVGAYIEATQHVLATPITDSDLDHLLDFDLSTLAAEKEQFAKYGAAIRREYAHVPDAIYRAGRVKFFEAMLKRPQIYRVPRLAAFWEARARENIAAELAILAS